MSKLDRMRISGIRSFGPEKEDAQDIKFQSPLTLFLGQNGCGKTTIIEVLKYAVTGDIPAGTHMGQGWLYDPKLNNGYETRAQVKLRVLNVLGEQETVSKTMSVVQKRDKLEFKRLDSAITKGGVQISGKVAEIDAHMCQALGVSRAILNNVTFCHQEDSNWPLDEPKKLKEKFDEIFDTTRYNKCLDLLLGARKTYSEKLKLLKLKLEHSEIRKKEVKDKKKALYEKEEKLQALNTEVKTLLDKLRPIETKLREIEQVEKNFTTLYSEAETKKNMLKSLKERQQEILSIIKDEFVGTDDELRQKIAMFEKNVSNAESKKREMENRILAIESDENKLRKQISDSQCKLGILRSEEHQNRNREHQYLTILKQIGRAVDVDVDDTGSMNNIRAHVPFISQKIQNMEDAIQQLEKNSENDDRLQQKKIDELRERFAKSNQKIASKNQQLDELRNELRRVTEKLRDLSTSDKELNFVESKIDRLSKECQALEASCDIISLKDEIEGGKRNVDDLEDKLNVIGKEIQTLQNYSALQTEVDLKRETLFRIESDLRKLKDRHETDFVAIFPEGVPTDDRIKEEVDGYQRKQNAAVKEFNAKMNEAQRETIKLDSKVQVLKDKLSSLEIEVATGRAELLDSCGDESYENIVANTRKGIDRLQKDKGTYSSSKYLFQKFIEQFQKDSPCCPICKTSIKERELIRNIIADLNHKIEDFPHKLKTTEDSLFESDLKYKKLLELKPTNDKIQKLEDEVPRLRNEITETEARLSETKKRLSMCRDALQEAQRKLELCNAVASDVSLIDKYQRDIKVCKREVESLSARIPWNEASRSVQEALAEQDSLKIDYNTQRNAVEALRNKLQQHSDRLQNVKEQRTELMTRQLTIKTLLQGKDQFITKRNELDEKIKLLDVEVDNLLSEIRPLKEELEKTIKSKEQRRKDNKATISAKKVEINEPKRLQTELQSLEKQMDDYESKHDASQITQVESNINDCTAKLDEKSQAKTSIKNQIDEVKSLIANSRNAFRELQDNVQLREKKERIVTLSEEIAELDLKLGDSDITAKRKEKERMQRDGCKIQGDKNRIEGKIAELKETLAEAKRDLALPENAQASLDYKTRYLQFIITEKAAADLFQFSKCVDWAMMQFHKRRMVQVNCIIRELWRSIYRGNDCDYIEIKTEMGIRRGLDKRRTFDYRVIQVKNDIEIDMRGRCSAGQKVLASLIIRVALADTFSSNCGILALDEPTTNLDRENITSLSEALRHLIDQKQRHKNFQLLIITHDEEFLNKITGAGGAYTYYVVSRNAKGKSTITEKTA